MRAGKRIYRGIMGILIYYLAMIGNKLQLLQGLLFGMQLIQKKKTLLLMQKIQIKLVKSAIGYNVKKKNTLKALGLTKMNKVVINLLFFTATRKKRKQKVKTRLKNQ